VPPTLMTALCEEEVHGGGGARKSPGGWQRLGFANGWFRMLESRTALSRPRMDSRTG